MSYVYLLLLSLAFAAIECMVGGTRLVFSLPVYALLGVASLLTLFSIVRPPKIRPATLCLISSALFFGYILVRNRFSPVDYLARDDFAMVLGSLAIYLLTALYFVKSKPRMQLIGVLLLIALAQVLLGLIQFTHGRDDMFFGFRRFPVGNRASGMYISPNHLAGYLEVVGIIGASLVFWSTWKPWAKILAGYISLLALAGILITGSRGGYVSTFVCILVFFVLGIVVIQIAYPERLMRVVLIGGIVVALIGGSLPFLVTSPLVKSRVATIVDQKNMRRFMWIAAWKQTGLAPAFGTGSGTYLYYGRKFRDASVQNDPIRAHNDYLDLLAEYGFVGMAGFLFFLIAHLQNGLHTFFWLVRKRLQFSADWRSSSLALNIGCLCAVAAYIIHSFVDFNLHIPANSMLMAFVFGVLANPGLETAHETKLSARTSRIFQFTLPALGALILAFAIPRFPGEYYAEKARVALRDGQELLESEQKTTAQADTAPGQKSPALYFYEAREAAQAGLEREGKNPDLYYYLGEAELSLGNQFPIPELAKPYYQAASDAFIKAIVLFPEDDRLLLIEGWTLDAMGEHNEAGEFFQKAVEWDPDSNDVRSSVLSHIEYIRALDQSKQDQPQPSQGQPQPSQGQPQPSPGQPHP